MVISYCTSKYMKYRKSNFIYLNYVAVQERVWCDCNHTDVPASTPTTLGV